MESQKLAGKADRVGGGIVIGAAGIMIAGAAIGFIAPSLREAPWTDDPQRAAEAIAGNPGAHAWANSLILAASLLTALGLVPISDGFQGQSRPWAWAAMVAFSFAAAFEAIVRIINVRVVAWAAQQGLEVADPAVQAFIRFRAGLSYGFYVTGFLALILYGIAMLQRAGTREFGWLFVTGGSLGLVLQVVGATIPAMVFFGTAALGAAIWLTGSGTDRRSRA